MSQAIDQRYSKLAEQSCCLSCGKSIERVELRPGQVCVDLGSGRGTDVLRMAEAVGPTGHAYGVDLAGGMVDKARRTADKLGVRNATFLSSSFEQLALEDGIADWVISNCALNHAQDKHAVWREIHRVLRHGGRFVVSDIYAVDEVSAEWRNDPEAVAECWAGAVVREQYLEHVGTAGLVDIRVVEESEPYDKGQARVASFTITGRKPQGEQVACCCCDTEGS